MCAGFFFSFEPCAIVISVCLGRFVQSEFRGVPNPQMASPIPNPPRRHPQTLPTQKWHPKHHNAQLHSSCRQECTPSEPSSYPPFQRDISVPQVLPGNSGLNTGGWGSHWGRGSGVRPSINHCELQLQKPSLQCNHISNHQGAVTISPLFSALVLCCVVCSAIVTSFSCQTLCILFISF